eukprot:tig00000144_g9018.t1
MRATTAPSAAGGGTNGATLGAGTRSTGLGSEAAAAAAAGARDADLRAKEVADAVLRDMDLTADPCDDFYQYACGGWLARTEIPADTNAWSRSFTTISLSNREILRGILEDKWPLLSSYYASCMDVAAIDKRGVEPIKPWVEKIDAIVTAADLGRVQAELFTLGVTTFYGYSISPDSKNPNVYIMEFKQAGLSMPKDKYVDLRQGPIRQKFLDHVTDLLVLMGTPFDTAYDASRRILELETELANATLPASTLRDPEASYHPTSLAAFEQAYPNIPLRPMLAAIVPYPEYPGFIYNVESPKFIAKVNEVIGTTDVGTLKQYLKWHLVHGVASYLASSVVNETFEFYSQELMGQEEIAPKWKRCVASADSLLGELLGRYYVLERFNEKDRAKAKELIDFIEAAFEEHLPGVSWMDPKTRAAALKKLKQMNNKVGYPDRWIDYTQLSFDKADFFGNFVKAKKYEVARAWQRFGQPVDRLRWQMTPPTVNAYYNPSMNEMVFPAGIIQEPFFSSTFPAAMNFGGIGMVMGHELTHGFDDQGRKFDGTGNVTEWWSPDVEKAFEERAKCVQRKYGAYSLPEGRINPKLTMGENIADMGGVRLAWFAYQSWKAARGGERADPSPTTLLTPDQLYFVAFAQNWCQKKRPEYQKIMLRSDPHSPGKFRVLGSLSSFPEFAKAYNCPAGTELNPPADERCEVW